MPKIRKSKFDLSHERKLTLNMGELVPVMLQEVLPGDKFKVNTELFMRLAPMLAPTMHRVQVFVHYHFVPYRLCWSEFQDFITGGRDGDLAPVVPFLDFGSPTAADRWKNGSLADYFGLPTYPTGATLQNPTPISALPFRAYQLIYNEYYRDQNLSNPVPVPLTSGAVSGQQLLDITQIRKRAWEKDYFTSALPWAQRGDPAKVPVETDLAPAKVMHAEGSNSAPGTAPGVQQLGTLADGTLTDSGSSLSKLTIENESFVTAEAIRVGQRMQEWLERNARGGARYIEQILAHWGVLSSDARLQRPEYLGGGKVPVVMSEVLSTFQFSGDAEGEPQGNMSGHGISAGSGLGFNRRFEEHGVIIGIMSVLPKTNYQQGIHRMWKRFDKFDFPWPVFANLGEQEVKESELYWDATSAPTQDGTFGYQERYAECKYGHSTTHGYFRDSLDFWGMTRIFASKPSLNENFVMSDPTTRIFAVTDPDTHHLYCQLYNRVSAIRALPFYGTPRI